MKFVYPEFLWSLFALSIPVIIHLFNFRKYKTLYFSSLKFIKHVDQQTRSTQKLKHLLVLILRLLALGSLIFAFAQPYIPVKSSGVSGGKPVLAIYIDNSFSMTAKGTEGELLSEAREMTRKLIAQAPLDTRILLNTNKLDGIEQRLITKIEALDLIDKIEPIALNRKLDDVLNWQRSFIQRESETHQKVGTIQYVFFSDFQDVTAKFSTLPANKNDYYYPIRMQAQEQSNMFVDSVWFSSPIQKIGQNNELKVRVVNSGDEDLTNVELHCEVGAVKRDVFLDIPANEKTSTTINYTDKHAGDVTGKISLNDKQLYWDDDFYFSYFVDHSTSVLILNGDDASSAVSTVYGLEKFYVVKSIDQNSFTLDKLNNVDLVFINGINEIPSGMAQNLKDFAQSGGAIALFPGIKCNTDSWNDLLSSLRLPLFGNILTSGTKIDKLINEDPFFYGMFEKKTTNLNLPSVSKIYQTRSRQNSNYYELIRLQNGAPLFLRSDGEINAFLFTSSLAKEFGTFTSNALFPSIILRIGEMSQRKAPVSLTIGKESYFPIYHKQSGETPIHLKSKTIDFIPQVKTLGLISYLSIGGQEAIELLKAGTYDILSDKKESVVSLNYDRSESTTACIDKQQIVDSLEAKGIANVSMKEITNGQSLTKIELEKPFEYWRLFLIFALLFLVGEILVIKLWK
jgi:hypothetical protein